MYWHKLATKAIAEAFEKGFSRPAPDNVLQTLEVPPDSSLGDFAFPCFKLAKELRMAPPKIAQTLKENFSSTQFERTEVKGAYFNLFVNKEAFASSVIEDVLSSGDRYGSSDLGQGKTCCIDFSSINIAKRFHIGHLSTTLIGAALARIYRFQNWNVVSINHLGDWGTQFGNMIAAYKLWGNPEMIEQGGVQALSDLYVRFHKEAEEDKALLNLGREWFKKIEDGDEEALSIFNYFKELTLKDAQKVYELLGIEFDSYAGESFYNDKMTPVIDELRQKDLLTESDGALVVDLSELDMPPCLILKSDGATLYATRDLAAALYRKKTYDFSKCLYVVAYQQDLHFRQLFAVLKKMGYSWAESQMEHVAFGMVSYEGESLSTRKGKVIYLDDLLKKAQEKAYDILLEKSPGIKDKDTVARQVGIGAVIYATLQNNRIKDIDFWWDRALNFDGETGPYVQYTYARCQSVLQKGAEVQDSPDYTCLESAVSQEALKNLYSFPKALQDALNRNEPYIITRCITDIAKSYNRFYYEERILTENKEQTAARLALTRAVAQTIKTGCGLLGIEMPDKM
ncbi:MAG: arginine--tRNA ligase [Eubacteriales bacterium]|nr:arginine--tRNA ligase [Eubacteriales bacterium]